MDPMGKGFPTTNGQAVWSTWTSLAEICDVKCEMGKCSNRHVVVVQKHAPSMAFLLLYPGGPKKLSVKDFPLDSYVSTIFK